MCWIIDENEPTLRRGLEVLCMGGGEEGRGGEDEERDELHLGDGRG